MGRGSVCHGRPRPAFHGRIRRHAAAEPRHTPTILQSAFGAEDLQARWRLRVVPPAGPVLTFLQAESYEHYFTAYIEAPENREGAYSFIAVQGMARLAALRRAVKLLQPSVRARGGMMCVVNVTQGAWPAPGRFTESMQILFLNQ